MQWAAQGVALLGIDRIRHYVRRTRYINTLFIDECLSADTLAEYAHMWHSHKAAQCCHDAAYRLIGTRPIPAGPPSHTRTLAAPLSRSGI